MVFMSLLALLAAGLEPDLIVVNARVRTMDARSTLAEALAVRDGRIAKVGTSREIRALAGPSSRVIDAEGRLVLPGFNDAHVHFLSGGFQLSSVDLRDAGTREEFTARIKDFAAKLPKGRWVLGGDWDHELWPGAPLPRRDWIDAATPDTPVFVSRLDGHMALANSLALKLAGVTRNTVDPPGGLIVRDPATGEPAGVLKDAAMNLVYKVIPAYTVEEKVAAARAATRHAASLGVTSVTDVSAGPDVGVYQTLLSRGELDTRIYAAWPLPGWKQLAATGIRQGFGGPMLRIGALKGFADGSLGSTTALFDEPYSDDPSTNGLPSGEMADPATMQARMTGAARAGLQLCLHAIGDKANAMILDMFAKTLEETGVRGPRFRIEHAQHLSPRDIPRFKQFGVIASMQPYHAADDGRWAGKRIGAQRSATTYAFRSLLDAGAVLAFGSDWTVAPLNPLLGIHAAVTRRTIDGKNPQGWVPAQKITVEEAVRAYTAGSAYAEFMEAEKGTIEAGKLADFVILSRDIFTVELESIDRTRVLMTVVGGRVVHQSRE
jgi:hypothetical protein